MPKAGAPLTEEERQRARETGRQGGLKSAETRRAKAAMRADLKARQKFVDAAEEVAQELLDAALGKGRWAGNGKGPLLDAKERAGLLKTCLEYGVGRPRPQDPMSVDEGPDDTPKSGFRFGVAEGTDAEPAGRDEPVAGPSAGPAG